MYQFVEGHFVDRTKNTIWAKKQEKLLKESQVTDVIQNIITLVDSNHKEAQKLIDYYEGNTDRMDYKKYKKIGAGIIGYGAIEPARIGRSAHRIVIQKRVKLSGQRWSKIGA